jgi:glutamyl-tRNA synthetase
LLLLSCVLNARFLTFDETKDAMTGSKKPVVTRLAPSPTGALHIGTARTALFNWLYAKHTGGKFLLRIEDTDRERSKDEYTTRILDSLKWLGLDWDGEPVSQFARIARHQEVGAQLLKDGRAYRCYLTPAELDAMRQKAQAEKTPFVIQSPWRDADPATAPKDVKPAIRLKTARTGVTVVDDLVQGRIEFPNKDLDDLVILRSDGVPTYNFAVVVDDHDMEVTHVIRGADHLTNAARQTQVYQACGWDLPAFGHIPLVHGADGAKLSKRHGAQGAEEFRAMGYLPAALRNYLCRLAWSHGDDEIFSTEQAIAWFDVKDVGRSAGRFDFKKLGDLNGHYIRQASMDELLEHMSAALPRIPSLDEVTTLVDEKAPPRSDLQLMQAVKEVRPDLKTGADVMAAFDAVGRDKLLAALPSLRERAQSLADIATGALYLLVKRPLPLDAKAKALIDADAKTALAALAEKFAASNAWDAASLEAIVREHAEATGAKLGKLAQPLRAALTGRAVSPPVFDVMAVLGRDEALARLRDQV